MMQRRKRTGWTRATVVLSTAILFCVLFGSTAAAAPSDGTGINFALSPPYGDSYYQWRTQVTYVSLMPQDSGTVMYQWDSNLGPWTKYEAPVLAPEGKHYLHVSLLTQDGVESTRVHEVKIDYDAPVRDVSAIGVTPQKIQNRSSGVTVFAEVIPWAGATVQRLGGADRYETSALISGSNFDTADTVIIATGYTFADALSASGLAGCLEAPVLLTRPDGLPSEIRTEITRLRASSAVVVGGQLSVGAEVERQLTGMGLTVKRIGGVDRYETASLIGQEVLTYGLNWGRVFIARGDGYADALALGPLAFGAQAPLLLVKPYEVPSFTRDLLGSGGFVGGAIAGGEVSIQPGVAAEIVSLVPGMERVAGATRYETAGAVASYGVNSGISDWEYIGIATGAGFPDALCGGAAAGNQGGIILLTPPDALPDPTESRITSNVGIVVGVDLFGGVNTVRDSVWDEILTLTR